MTEAVFKYIPQEAVVSLLIGLVILLVYLEAGFFRYFSYFFLLRLQLAYLIPSVFLMASYLWLFMHEVFGKYYLIKVALWQKHLERLF